MLSTASANALNDNDIADDNIEETPCQKALQPQESNVVSLWNDGPFAYIPQQTSLTAAPAIDIVDEQTVAVEDAAPSPVTTLLSIASHAEEKDDQSDVESDDDADVFDKPYVDFVEDVNVVIIEDEKPAAGAFDQDEMVLTSSGCSLKPHRRHASKTAAGPDEMTLTETACKLKPVRSEKPVTREARVSDDAEAYSETEAFQQDEDLSTEETADDLEESLYFTIGGMIIPSFFAKATGYKVKTHTVCYDLMPTGWDASIEDLGEAFETTSALMAYLARHADDAALSETLNGKSEEQREAFSQDVEAARANGYCLFAHKGSMEGLFSVSVPVFANDQVAGAVGIFLPRALTTGDNLETHLLPQLRLMAEAVAQTPIHDIDTDDAAKEETHVAMAA